MSWCQMSRLCYTRLCLNVEKRNVVFQLMFSRVLYCCLECKPSNPSFFLTFWNRHLLKEESSSGRAAPQSCFFRKNVIFNHQQWLWVCVSVLPLEHQKPVWQKYYQLLLQSLAKSFAFWSERRDNQKVVHQAGKQHRQHATTSEFAQSGWQWLSSSLNVLHIVQSYNIIFPLASIA